MLEAERSQDTDPGNTQLGLFATHDTLTSPRPAVSASDPQPREDRRPPDPRSPGSAAPGEGAPVPAGACEPTSGSVEEVREPGRPGSSPLLAPSAEGGSPRLENTGDNTRAAASDAVHPEKSANPCILSPSVRRRHTWSARG